MAFTNKSGTGNHPKRKFVIDTDAGIDDAQAILLALSSSNIDVVAITTVHGNVDCDQVGRNVLRLLKVAGRLDIPVYKGADKPLLGKQINSSHYHGNDGFGDVPDPDAPGEEMLKEEFAVNTLIRLANQYKGELELICLGPLTNVAMAIRTDAHFGQKLKHCYIMGGNYEGKGNISCSAEFNFFSDPEAAYIALNDLRSPITIACWELCLKYSFSWDEYEELRRKKTPRNQFLSHIEKAPVQSCKDKGWPAYIPCDEVAVAIAIDDNIVTSSLTAFATVETKGEFTRGQMVIDWRGHLKKPPNVKVVTGLDRSLYRNMLLGSIS